MHFIGSSSSFLADEESNALIIIGNAIAMNIVTTRDFERREVSGMLRIALRIEVKSLG